MMSRSGNNSRLLRMRKRFNWRNPKKMHYKMRRWVWKQERGKKSLKTRTMRQRTYQKITSRPSLPSYWKTKLTWKDSWIKWSNMDIWQATLEQKCNALLRLWGKKKNWRSIPYREWKVCGPIQKAERPWGSSHASSSERDRWGTSLAPKSRKRCRT